MLKKLFTFPPFLGCLAALIVPRFFSLEPLEPALDALVSTLSPLALFSIGTRIDWRHAGDLWPVVGAGLAYKTCVAPVLVLALALAFGVSPDLARITVFESAMGPHITASLLALEYGLNPRLSALLAGVGIPAALAATLAWWWILGFFY